MKLKGAKRRMSAEWSKCVLVLKKHDMFDVAAVAEGGVR